MRRLSIACTLLVFVLATGAAGAATLAGVSMPDRVTVAGEPLVLNGLGLRKKLFIKVYVAGLYLPAKQGDASKVLAADSPRRTVLHFLYDVDRGKICEAWNEGLANNVANPSAELTGKFTTLCSWMEDMDKGETMSFTYVPGTGTTVEVGGRSKGTLPGKPFADALWGAWIGKKPPSEDFKQGLLGV
ncbi:MAG TPA: chalcone isomerase family protein [Thermoanaerobaculia bacterium]|nr:chalcone isomerase family protein [Thermoanaerobaculia bacterium]